LKTVLDLSESAAKQGLENFVAQAASTSSARIISMRRLGGGAVSENWAVDMTIHGSRLAGEHCSAASNSCKNVIPSLFFGD